MFPLAGHATCADLRAARIPRVTVFEAGERPPNATLPPLRAGLSSAPGDLPGYCRLRAVIAPAKGPSAIGGTLYGPVAAVLLYRKPINAS